MESDMDADFNCEGADFSRACLMPSLVRSETVSPSLGGVMAAGGMIAVMWQGNSCVLRRVDVRGSQGVREPGTVIASMSRERDKTLGRRFICIKIFGQESHLPITRGLLTQECLPSPTLVLRSTAASLPVVPVGRAVYLEFLFFSSP